MFFGCFLKILFRFGIVFWGFFSLLSSTGRCHSKSGTSVMYLVFLLTGRGTEV